MRSASQKNTGTLQDEELRLETQQHLQHFEVNLEMGVAMILKFHIYGNGAERDRVIGQRTGELAAGIDGRKRILRSHLLDGSSRRIE